MIEHLLGQVHCGDFMDFICTFDGKVDLVFCDPPYNRGKDYGVYKDNLPDEDYKAWVEVMMSYFHMIARGGIAVFVPATLALTYWRYMPKAEQIVIRKGAYGSNGGGWRQQYFVVLTNAKPIDPKGAPNLIEHVRLPGEGYYFNEERFDHPGQTSQALTEWVIETLTRPGEIVYDPFMGTGTTAVACEKLGRRWVGTELNPAYIKIANQRVAAEMAKVKLF